MLDAASVEAASLAGGADLDGLSGPIMPLLRRHLQDAAFYDMQLRKSQQRADLQASDASAPPPLSPEKTQQFEALLAAHLDGIWVAGPAAWPLALEALQRWRKSSEAFAAAWALLALGTPATASRPEQADEAQLAAAWSDWGQEMWRQRAHWDAHLRVIGPRRWFRTLGLCQLSSPEPFLSMPLHYGMAFGGTRWYEKGRDRLCEAHLENPAGLGFAGRRTIGQVNEAPAPSLECPRNPIKSPDGRYVPCALSAVARHWSPRRELAGTYDEQWREEVFPFLPDDFDEAFNQAAPLDQRVSYLTGGEPVQLDGLVPNRRGVRFVLPRLEQGVRVLRTDYSQELPGMVVDTLYIEPESHRFSVVWRAAVPIRRKIQEFSTITIGPVDEAWWAAKASGSLDGGCVSCRKPSKGAGLPDDEEED